MRLATLHDGTRDGALVVVSADGQQMRSARAIAPTLQHALDRWRAIQPALEELAGDDGSPEWEPLERARCMAPLPRAFEWVDGSAYINHVVLVRRARGAEPPATLREDPLVYQGGAGVLLGPRDPIPLPDPQWGLDFEAEVCVILDDTPRGTVASLAEEHVALLTICNDLTFRNLIPSELDKGFGFFQSKPATAFAPFAITPDELGGRWAEGRASLTMSVRLNGEQVGRTHTGEEMHFSFHDLIAHIARTRAFTAGTILGSGTISNEAEARGVSCLAERRMREILKYGEASTPFLAIGDVVEIEAIDDAGRRPFGTIRQEVIA